MLFSSITPSDEFVFAWRRGAPEIREPGTFPRSSVSCSCARVTATAMRFVVVAQSLAATNGLRSADHAATRPTKGRPGSSCGIYVTLCEAGDVAGHGGTVNQIHLVARGRGYCSGARRLERLGVRRRTEARRNRHSVSDAGDP